MNIILINPWQKRSVSPLHARVWQSAWMHVDLEKLFFLKSCLTLMGLKCGVCCTRARSKFSSSESGRACVPGPVFCYAVGSWQGKSPLLSAESRDVEIFCTGEIRVQRTSGEEGQEVHPSAMELSGSLSLALLLPSEAALSKQH